MTERGKTTGAEARAWVSSDAVCALCAGEQIDETKAKHIIDTLTIAGFDVIRRPKPPSGPLAGL